MCDLLPASVHEILNDVETSLSLPVMLVIIACTLQFFFCHSMHIICTFNEIMKKRAERAKRMKKCVKPGPSLMERIKKMLCCSGKKKCEKTCKRVPKRKPACKPKCATVETPAVEEDDWDDVGDDVDDDDIDDLDIDD